ncbi:hypothetical protein IGI67_000302 [Enterococcus sp. AZ196]
MNLLDFEWTRLPESYQLSKNSLEVITKTPHRSLAKYLLSFPK